MFFPRVCMKEQTVHPPPVMLLKQWVCGCGGPVGMSPGNALKLSSNLMSLMWPFGEFFFYVDI